jgi:hypothetical protein
MRTDNKGSRIGKAFKFATTVGTIAATHSQELARVGRSTRDLAAAVKGARAKEVGVVRDAQVRAATVESVRSFRALVASLRSEGAAAPPEVFQTSEMPHEAQGDELGWPAEIANQFGLWQACFNVETPEQAAALLGEFEHHGDLYGFMVAKAILDPTDENVQSAFEALSHLTAAERAGLEGVPEAQQESLKAAIQGMHEDVAAALSDHLSHAKGEPEKPAGKHARTE